MNLAAKRRWFAFSLRTLFVAVTILACWLGYEMNWIRQRHEVLSRCQWVFRTYFSNKAELPPPTRAPQLLWLFGEPGYAQLFLKFKTDVGRKLTAAEEDEVRRARRLFPEAEVQGAAFPPAIYNDSGPTIL